jgi:hypothetical protein
VGSISRYTWIGLLTVAVLLGTALSCKQVKELAIPGPDSDATALYVLKIVNIQPDDIDMNTEGTASATVFARLTDARGTPLGGQVLFFEVLDVEQVPFLASDGTQTKVCVGTLPGAFFGNLRFRYRTTDGDGRAQTEFTPVRVIKFMDLALAALMAQASDQQCLGGPAVSIELLQSSFLLPIRVRWNDPQYNLQVFDVRPLEVHIPQFWHD